MIPAATRLDGEYIIIRQVIVVLGTGMSIWQQVVLRLVIPMQKEFQTLL